MDVELLKTELMGKLHVHTYVCECAYEDVYIHECLYACVCMYWGNLMRCCKYSPLPTCALNT